MFMYVRSGTFQFTGDCASVRLEMTTHATPCMTNCERHELWGLPTTRHTIHKRAQTHKLLTRGSPASFLTQDPATHALSRRELNVGVQAPAATQMNSLQQCGTPGLSTQHLSRAGHWIVDSSGCS